MAAPANLNGKLLFPFIAPPNGGKGTQTRVLSKNYNLPTFDMGATFRSILKDGKDPVLAQELQSYMSQGKLVPIATVMKVFQKGFEDLAAQHPNVKGFILDGFPRNLDQANELLKLCSTWGAQVAKVIYLNVSIPVVEQRATGRRFCSVDANHVYNINEPKFAPKNKKLDANGQPVLDAKGQEIWLCDQDNADLVLRADDEPATVKKRLVEYQQETDPVINQFKTSGHLAEINGELPADQVTKEIEKVVQPVLGLTPTP